MLDFAEQARAVLVDSKRSSASAERLFGDAGYQEGVRRQHVETGIVEMLLTIRYLIQQRTNVHAVRARCCASGRRARRGSDTVLSVGSRNCQKDHF